jgi:hypothetical protein
MISSGHMKPRVPPPVVALVAVVVMWFLHRRLPMARWIEPPWSWLGIVPAAVGVGIDVRAFRHFRHVGTRARRTIRSAVSGLSSRSGPLDRPLTHSIVTPRAHWTGPGSIPRVPRHRIRTRNRDGWADRESIGRANGC